MARNIFINAIKMAKEKNKIQIGSNFYKFEIKKDGEILIEGETVPEFYETLSDEDKIRMAKVGKISLEDRKNGTYKKGKYQYYAIE